MAQRSSLVLGYTGYLEKNSGLMKTKTKFWCSLDGHVMYWSKEIKRASGIETLNLMDAQTVRKVNSDTSGTQFEIIMKKNKKTHVFTAPTTEECSTWIKKLQCSMISESPADSSRTSQFFVDNVGDDVSLTPPDNQGTTGKSAASKADVKIKLTVSAPEGEYAEIGDMCSGVKMRNSLGTKRNSTKPASLPSSKDSPSENFKSKHVDPEPQYASVDDFVGIININEIYSDAASDGATENKPALLSPSGGPPPSEVTDLYATVNKKRQESPSSEALADDVLDLLDVLDFTKPVPLIALQEEDYEPLRDVKLFLENNKDVCRYSHSILQPGQDPVEQMKKILKDIG